MDTPPHSTEPHVLESQVGGHAGVMTTEDGSLLIKPAHPAEYTFYQMLQQNPSLQELRRFTPRFYGTLKLEGTVDVDKPLETDGLVVKPVSAEDAHPSLVLENLSYRFLKPNILDIKLGTVLYDAEASPEKIQRMIDTAKATTSFETGVRLTGFQVYNNKTGKPVNTPKSYGKTIKPSQLGEGIANFFPVASSATTPDSKSEEEKAAFGLPYDTLVHVLTAIRDELKKIRDVYAGLEIRMVGGSILVVYEADWERAVEGLKGMGSDKEQKHKRNGDMDDEDDDDDDDGDDDDEDEEEEEDEEGNPKKIGPPYSVKLIDFAHTILVPGQGPDEGVLLGIDTVLRLLQERLDAIQV